MEIADYHTEILVHELTRGCASEEVDKLATVLIDGQVDLSGSDRPNAETAELVANRAGEDLQKFKVVGLRW